MVCHGDWEPRQPQDYVKGVADIIRAPWTRPEQADSFISFGGANFLNALSTSNASIGIRVISYTSTKRELDGKALNSLTIG